MTADVPFSLAARPDALPGDAERAPRELMTLPGYYRDTRRWRLVEIRVGGGWRPAMLTVWRRPPGSAVWVVHVTWGPGDFWGWFLFDERVVRPLPEPPDEPPARPPYFGRWRDATVVPAELAGQPARDGADDCWRLAWVRAGGRWRSALVTAQRRPGPALPWIVHARWGEDKAAAWLVADPITLRPVTATGETVSSPGTFADTGGPAGTTEGTGAGGER
ncbi:hypothetical protein ACFU7Y_02885 [Kitasatospora sp. NPDC057542]|uniref:hypothetical protein n=1 Tax=Kitasatospora sp. NPDC057542 TaxID=3346162 RepID=UPI003679E7D1